MIVSAKAAAVPWLQSGVVSSTAEEGRVTAVKGEAALDKVSGIGYRSHKGGAYLVGLFVLDSLSCCDRRSR